jgi:hypothetical protein
MTSFVAFAVDINGTALARCDLAATEKEAAEQEARQYIERPEARPVATSEAWLASFFRFRPSMNNAIRAKSGLLVSRADEAFSSTPLAPVS